MAMFLLPIGEVKARLMSGRDGVLFGFWVWWVFMGLFGSCCVLVGLGFFVVFLFFFLFFCLLFFFFLSLSCILLMY
jgi:hypothetical protein